MYRARRIIFFLLILAMIPRCISLVTFDFIDSGGGSDSVTYIALARNLFAGRGYTEFGRPHTVHHPFYPITIGLVWRLTGDLAFSARLVSTLAGILLVIPVFFLARGLFGRRTGILAGLLAALFPILVYASSESFSESLYTLLLISGLAAGWLTHRSRSILYPVLAGLFLGLSFCTHPLGVVFLPLIAGFNLLAGRRRSRLKVRIRAVFLICLTFAVTCLPFWIHLRSVTGHWQLSGSSHYQDFGLRYDQSRGVAESKVIFEHMEDLFHSAPSTTSDRKPIGMLKLIVSHPDRFLRIIRFNLRDGYFEAVKTARYLSLPPVAFFSLLGGGLLLLLLAFSRAFFIPRRCAAAAYLVLMFLPLGIFLIMQIEHRYFYPFIPPALIAFAWILAEILRWSGRHPFARRIFLFFSLALYLALAAASGFIVYRKAVKKGIPYEYKLMGDWMKQNIPGIAREKVMMFRPGISYYAGCDWNVFYWGDREGLKDYLKGRNISYLVVDRYKLDMIHPDLHFLLTAETLPHGFKLVREIDFQGRKIRLLEYTPGSD